MQNWLIRAALITPVMIVLALILKIYLIAPYGVNVLEFEIEVEKVLKKSDREI